MKSMHVHNERSKPRKYRTKETEKKRNIEKSAEFYKDPRSGNNAYLENHQESSLRILEVSSDVARVATVNFAHVHRVSTGTNTDRRPMIPKNHRVYKKKDRNLFNTHVGIISLVQTKRKKNASGCVDQAYTRETTSRSIVLVEKQARDRNSELIPVGQGCE